MTVRVPTVVGFNDVEKSTKILNDIRNNYTDDVEIMEKIDYIYGLMMKK